MKKTKQYGYAVLAFLLFGCLAMFSCKNPVSGNKDTPIVYTVNVTQPVGGGGTIGANPASAAAGKTITLTATPANGYHFGGFIVTPSQTLSGTGNIRTFTMPAGDVSVTAVFISNAAPTYGITVTQPVGGGGTIEADKLTAAAEEVVTLTAHPADGYHLDTFTVTPHQDLSGSGNIHTFTMPGEPVTVTAVFVSNAAQTYGITVTQPVGGGGTIEADKSTAAAGETVTLTAYPAYRYELAHFTVTPHQDLNGTGNIQTFIMPATAVNVTALFAEDDTLNLALGKGADAVASRVSEWNQTAVAANAFDGIRYTGAGDVAHWQGQGQYNPAQWIGVDLGEVYEIGYVIVVYHAPGNDIFTAGVIQVEATEGDKPVSMVAENYTDDEWRTVASFRNLNKWETAVAPGPAMGWKNVITLTPGTRARYIRVKMAEFLTDPPAWTLWPRVSSFEVYKVLPAGETPDTPLQLYTVTKGAPSVGGDFTINLPSTVAGATVTLNCLPETGYGLDRWSVTPSFVVPTGSLNTWTFTMPPQNVTIRATFKSSPLRIIENMDAVKGRAWGWFEDFTNTTYGFWKVNGGHSADNSILAPDQGDYNAIATHLSNTRIVKMTPTAPQATAGFAIGRNLTAPVDISGTDTIRFLFRVSVDNSYALVLYNGGTPLAGYFNTSGETADNGTGYEVVFTNPAVNTWGWVEIPLSDFTGLDKSAVTGWGIRLKSRAGNGSFYLDTILADKLLSTSFVIKVNAEADFSGFPSNIVLNKTLSETLIISLVQYTSAKWYVDGNLKGEDGAYTLTTTGLDARAHSLMMEVTVNGLRYSKTVNFVVTE